MRRKGVREERRISVIDLFLLLLLLLSLLGGLLRWQDSRTRSEENMRTYRATLLSEVVFTESADTLAVGEWLFDPSGTPFGRIVAIERVSAPIVLETGSGSVRGEWDISKRCRLRVTVEIEGSARGGVLLLGGTTPFAVGGDRVLFSERMRLEIRLVEFSELTS